MVLVRLRATILGFPLIFLSVLGFSQQPADGNPPSQINYSQKNTRRTAEEMLYSVADKIYAHILSTSPIVRFHSGKPILRWADNSHDASKENAALASRMLAELDQLNKSQLTHEQQVFAAMIRYRMEVQVEAHEFYWLRFEITPYQAGFVVPAMHQVFMHHKFGAPSDLQVYLSLVRDYARWVNDLAIKVNGQARRNIRLPKPAIPAVMETWISYRSAVHTALAVSADRLIALPPELGAQFQKDTAALIANQLLPAYNHLLELFDEDYIGHAPSKVGQVIYPEGKSYYRHLVKLYGGPQYSPEKMHKLGLALMAELRKQRTDVRAELGFSRSEEDFHQMLRDDSRFRAASPQEVEQRYLGYMDKITPLVNRYFNVIPKAPYGVKRADPAVERGMTYGYYQEPTPVDNKGYYVYNGSNLEHRSLITAQHLIYHELVPGHHFHVALQQEKLDWHPLRKWIGAAAFEEGWAEYAASLAEDMGLYSDLYDYYGHLLNQSFLTSRVVVDTGMNYFGWTLDQARRYMSENTFESDTQIATETLRYATDLPAQGLAYCLVRHRLQTLRSEAKQTLGDRFDLRGFHDVLLNAGSLPMSVLVDHLRWYIEQQTE